MKQGFTNYVWLRKWTNAFLWIAMVFIFMGIGTSYANNIQVSNVSLMSKNTTTHSYMVKFDLSWDNSWRIATGSGYHDAVWIFIKYRIKNTTQWSHATLHWVNGSGSSDGHIVPSGAQINSSEDNGNGGAYGAIVSSSAIKTQGAATYNNVQLKWDYGADGLTDYDFVEISVFGIEMVYVPQGSFYIGDNESEGAFFDAASLGSYRVLNESSISVPSELNYAPIVDGMGPVLSTGDQSGPIPNAFPKGYSAFYITKYEISQQQYVDFLNNIGYPGYRVSYASPSNRHNITVSSQVYSTTNPYVACGALSAGDLMSYLDWSALRPMTEFEYEKACRGPAKANPNECAWGGSIVSSSVLSLSNSGAANENIFGGFSTTEGNAMYNTVKGTINGPVRCGVFAANSNNNGRMTSGGSFYGVMELSGNVSEFVVSVGDANSRSYIGNHGDGVLSNTSNYNQTSWPTVQFVYRGGNYYDSYLKLQVSDRQYAVSGGGTDFSDRQYYHGGRGVRTAP